MSADGQEVLPVMLDEDQGRLQARERRRGGGDDLQMRKMSHYLTAGHDP